MDLTPHVDHLRDQLVQLARTDDPDTSTAVERLVTTLESPVRLTLLEALSAAAAEITRELAPGSVDVRLRGGQADFVVTPPPPDGPATGPRTTAPSPPAPEEGEGTARINLRLPEHLKAGIDQAAEAEHVSINAWLVRLVASALSPDPDTRSAGTGGRVGQSWSGWVQ